MTRRPARSDDDGWSRAHGGLDPRDSRWVDGWLRLVRLAVRPLVGRGVSPDLLTLTGVVVSAAVPALTTLGGGWLALAAVVALLAAVLDGLDGALAVADGSATAWGRVLDPLADRCSDLAFLLALWLAGAPAWACVVLGALTLLHESVRSSARAAGMPGVGPITVWERPSRVIVTVVTLLAAAVVPTGTASAAGLATGGVGIGLLLAVVGLAHLTLRVRGSLSGLPDEPGDDASGQQHER